MARKHRALRDALLPFLVALVTFAYKQWVVGHLWTAGVTLVCVGVVFAAYRYLDHQLLRVVVDQGGADDLKPLLARLGGALRSRWRAYRDRKPRTEGRGERR